MAKSDYQRFQEQLAKGAGKPIKIPVEYIILDPHQPRKTIDDEEFQELVASIRENGQQVAAKVSPARKEKGVQFYVVDFGERRFRAHLFLGLKTIDCVISDTPYLGIKDINRKMTQAFENMNRASQNHAELTDLYREFRDDEIRKDPKIKIGDIKRKFGGKFGKSLAWVENYAALANLPIKYLSRVDTKDKKQKIPFMGAVELGRIRPDEQDQAFVDCEILAKGDRNKLYPLLVKKSRELKEARGEKVSGPSDSDATKLLRAVSRMTTFVTNIITDESGNLNPKKVMNTIDQMRGLQVDEFLRYTQPVCQVMKALHDAGEERKALLEKALSSNPTASKAKPIVKNNKVERTTKPKGVRADRKEDLVPLDLEDLNFGDGDC